MFHTIVLGIIYGSDDPTNRVVTPKDIRSTRPKAKPTRLSSLKSKVKNVAKKC